jgi:hypothetical protein
VGKTQRVTERFVEISFGKIYAHGLPLKNTIFLTVIYFLFTVQLKTQSIHDGKVNASLPAMCIFSHPILSISLPFEAKNSWFQFEFFFFFTLI